MRKIILIANILFSINAYSQSLWGLNENGGKGAGLIYQLDNNGNYMESFPFDKNEGRDPTYTNLTEDFSTGMLYGVTSSGGLYDFGIVFEFNPNTNTYTKIADFNSQNGASPEGALLLVNGLLYGTTLSGGANGTGVIFECNPVTNTIVKKIDLISATGINPYGSLLLASNGKLYGMTSAGGVNNVGVIFEYDISLNLYVKKIDFGTAGAIGSNPYGSLIEASNGKLYGMTKNGGINGNGNIFEYDYNTNICSNKINNIGSPYGSLTEALNGKIYGLSFNGGLNGLGHLFEYNPNTSGYSIKYSFPNNGSAAKPYGSLLEASNGKLIGMLSGANNNTPGIIFDYNPSTSTVNNLHTFNTINGALPMGSLIEYQSAGTGNLYGVTNGGGERSQGVLFTYNINSSSYTKMIDFSYDPKGSVPQPSLTKGLNGKLYGTTMTGGLNNLGTIFEFDTITKITTKKIDFSNASGYNANGLTLASNGKFYGTAKSGGLYTLGTIFEYNPISNTFSKLHDFVNGAGSTPTGMFTQASNGKLYGVGSGGLFEYDVANNLFILKPNTNWANTPLINSCNGKLYCISGSLIIEYDPLTNTKIQYNILASGQQPNGIMFASNGKIYGSTGYGGINNFGTLFEFNPINTTYTTLVDFNILNGKYPIGTLVQSSNGKLYGLTKEAGTNNKGIVFEYDYNSNTIAIKLDFSITLGNPYLSKHSMLTSGNNIDAQTAPTGSSAQSFCNNASVSDLVANGNQIQWYASATGGTPLSSNTILSNSTNYYASQLIYGCESQNRLAVAVSLIPNPNSSVTISGNTLTADQLGANYQWLDCDNNFALIQGENQISFTPAQTGNYALQVTQNGCTINSDCYYVENSSAGIQGLYADNGNLNVYPNPNNGVFTIENAEFGKYKIVNSVGQILIHFEIDTNDKKELNLGQISKGIYCIVSDDVPIKSKKIIIY
jgi:uncharacterized repeat protein (TIGR03803 family)